MSELKIEMLTENNINRWEEISSLFFDDKTNINSLKDFIQDKNSVAFFTCENENVVAFTYCYILKRLNSRPMFYLHSIDVLESHRRRGIGKMLLNHVIEYSKNNNFRNCFLITNKSNKAACKLYESLDGESANDDDIIYNWKNN